MIIHYEPCILINVYVHFIILRGFAEMVVFVHIF